MTSGNINRSLGLSALVIMSIAGLALTGSVAARADITPDPISPISVVKDYTGTPGPQGFNGWDYTYDVQVLATETVVSGDSFTFYDFNGYIAPASTTITNASGNWQVTYAFNDPPVQSIPNTTVPYDPSVPSVTFTYEGTGTIVGQSDLGDFTLESKYGYDAGDPELNQFDGTSLLTGTHVTNSNQTYYEAPTPGLTPGDGPPVQVTPEPGVFVTAASMLSMTGIGLVRGRRRAKGVKIAA